MRNFMPDQETIQRKKRGARIGAGVFIATLGVFMLVRTLGLLPNLQYLTRHAWAWALIAGGLFSVIHSRLRNPFGFVALLIGAANIVERFEVVNGVYSDELVWPVGVIAIGLLLIFRRRGARHPRHFKSVEPYESFSATSRLNINVTFGGRKEVVTAKNFEGGRLSANFAGVELNLLQAAPAGDGPMVLHLRLLFAGCEIVVPANWDVQNEISPTFGAVEDNRGYRAAAAPAEGGRRLLVLRGSCTCGSVEIKAY